MYFAVEKGYLQGFYNEFRELIKEILLIAVVKQ